MQDLLLGRKYLTISNREIFRTHEMGVINTKRCLENQSGNQALLMGTHSSRRETVNLLMIHTGMDMMWAVAEVYRPLTDVWPSLFG